MELTCTQEGCDGDVPVGWDLDGEVSKCSDCGHEYRVWGDETYDAATSESFDWWALTEPDGKNPWEVKKAVEKLAEIPEPAWSGEAWFEKLDELLGEVHNQVLGHTDFVYTITLLVTADRHRRKAVQEYNDDG